MKMAIFMVILVIELYWIIHWSHSKRKACNCFSHIFRYTVSSSKTKTHLFSNSSNLNWKLIWQNIQLSSRNPNHQVIHFNFIHRTYFTPCILHKMKALPSPNCTLCNQNALGTFFHMVWECPRVAEFWKRVAEMLSNILSKTIPYLSEVLLLNDISNLELCVKQKRLWLAGLTAAMRLIACRWKAPHSVTIQRWLLDLIDVASMEQWAANTHQAKRGNISHWKQAITIIKSFL